METVLNPVLPRIPVARGRDWLPGLSADDPGASMEEDSAHGPVGRNMLQVRSEARMWLLLLSGCLYDQNYLDWVYTQLDDADGDGFREIDEDCNDHDPAVHPGAYEVCDGIDNDCNGELDTDALDIRPWYQDRDQDGYGLEAVMRLSCEPVPTYTSEGGDCDDEDETIHLDADIVCGEAIDRDCNGDLDNLDQDQDGFPKCADCSDLDPRVHPGATERCNELDDDCNGVIDGPDADERLWYPDDDGDGYGDSTRELLSCDPSEEYVVQMGDCNDIDPSINPTATEICDDGIDENCDGTWNECSWPETLSSDASLVGVTDVGIGRGSLLNALVNAGDMDGDGHEELAFVNNGQVIVWHGPFEGVNQPVTTGYFVSVTAGSTGFGLVTSRLGDVDGDGLDDLGIADPMTGDGVVYLLKTETGDLSADDLWTLETPDPTYAFGLGMARSEDTLFVNTADMASSKSSLFVTSLPLTKGAPPVWQPILSNTDGISALEMTFLDVNGDGIQDLGTTVANLSGPGDALVPSIRIYQGPLTSGSLGDPEITLTTPAGFVFGITTTLSPGDVTGDGLDDLWLVPATNSIGSITGLAWLVKPDQSGDAENLSIATVIGSADRDEFTRFLAEDFNGDFQSDLLIGSKKSDSQVGADDAAGCIRLIYGPFRGTMDVSSVHNSEYRGTPHSWTGRWLEVGSFNNTLDLAVAAPGGTETTNADSRVDIFFDPS